MIHGCAVDQPRGHGTLGSHMDRRRALWCHPGQACPGPRSGALKAREPGPSRSRRGAPPERLGAPAAEPGPDGGIRIELLRREGRAADVTACHEEIRASGSKDVGLTEARRLCDSFVRRAGRRRSPDIPDCGRQAPADDLGSSVELKGTRPKTAQPVAIGLEARCARRNASFARMGSWTGAQLRIMLRRLFGDRGYDGRPAAGRPRSTKRSPCRPSLSSTTTATS